MTTIEQPGYATLFWLAVLAGTLGAALVSVVDAAEAAPTEEKLPGGPFQQTECVQCHQQQDPELIGGWRNGPHGSFDCTLCHGERHGQLPAARDDAACTRCHGGAVEHSYASSKHGVIMTLEQDRRGWAAPLKRGNYRAPGCAYCHQYNSDHGDTMDVTRGRHLREWICTGCHAPRYVTDQFAAGLALLEIGRLKVKEATDIAARHPKGLTALAELLEQVQMHLRNLRLGAGHQSPDYQWWHGQAALDGDLIRLRDLVAQTLRRSSLPETRKASPGRNSPKNTNDPEHPHGN